MINKFPKHQNLSGCLYLMGQSYEKLTRTDQAISFYKKVLSMNTDEEDATNIKARRALKALGA
jgi:tetratricopeptide (TPR) repeat protein